MEWGPDFTETFLAIRAEISGCYTSTECRNRRTAMKRLAILTFYVGVLVAPFQAHAQKPVEFNGMVFDPPPAQGYSQGYEAPKEPATKTKTSTHQQHHHHHHAHSAS
jgi:hypothetical protein